QANINVGSGLGVLCQVDGDGGLSFSDCVRSIGRLFASKEAKFVFKPGTSPNFGNTLPRRRIVGDLLGSAHFPVAHVTTHQTTRLPTCPLFAERWTPGAPVVYAVFRRFNNDRFQDIRMQFDNTALGLQNDDQFVTLVCEVNGPAQTISPSDTVKVHPTR